MQISLPTSFKWRHRILAALESSQNQVVLKGIVESDDMFITYSQKGQRNLDREPRKRGKGMLTVILQCLPLIKHSLMGSWEYWAKTYFKKKV
jgi:hypothetical protein